MPNYDGTGPFGDGRPGWGMGPCGRSGSPARAGYGRGFGRGNGRGYGRGFGPRNGRGYGRGYRWDYPSYDAPADSREMYPYSRENLEAQKEELQKQLEWLNEQIENLNKEN